MDIRRMMSVRMQMMFVFVISLWIVNVDAQEVPVTDYINLDSAVASASNIYDSNRPASNAIDGSVTACTVIKAASGSNSVWLQVDMGTQQSVTAVGLQPRSDGYPEQLSNIEIYVGSNATTVDGSMLCKSVSGNVIQDGALQRFDCANILTGRYVSVKKTAGSDSAQYITVCELKVLKPNDALEYINLGSAVASVSNPYDANRPASKAIDGDLSSYGYTDCAVAKPASGSNSTWLQVDMGKQESVTAVELIPRSEAFPTQLSNFKIYVGSEATTVNESMLCKSVSGNVIQDHSLQRFDCANILMGRYVTVKKIAGSSQAQYITVCELKVLKPKDVPVANEGEMQIQSVDIDFIVT